MIHPVTGEVLGSVEDYQRALAAVEESMAPFYRLRRQLRDGLASEHQVVMPSPRYRTDKQAEVARCPRCGTKLEAT